MGHLYSIFLRFHGGKGVATAAGCVLVVSPLTFLVCLSVYVLLVSIWGYSSLGSLTAATVMPVSLWMALHSAPLTASAVMMTAFIFIRHAENVKRLLTGEEDSVFDMH
jgi:glycerol-3-phosphate acyltransferase PlsY